jgi:hypothetical protein
LLLVTGFWLLAELQKKGQMPAASDQQPDTRWSLTNSDNNATVEYRRL